jgi:hypothetical protein
VRRFPTSLIAALLAGVVWTSAGCRPAAPSRDATDHQPEIRQLAEIAVPGLDHRGASIAALGGHVVVTWTAGGDTETNVYAAVSRNGGRTFGPPIRVNHLPGDARYSGEQAPRVAIGQDVIVVWQSRLNGKSAIRMARSHDGGESFSPAVTVHRDGLDGTRGWVSLTVDRAGTAHAAWLDTRPGRPAPPRPPAAGSNHVHGGMSTPQNIFYARAGNTGAPIETKVAPDVCFCCKTSVAVAGDGTIYTAWRHIFPPNLRDMAVARSSDGGKTFGTPVRLSEDGWAIDGCPEDGPAMAVDGDGVLHVTWPTIAPGKTDRKAIFYTYSIDGGRSFAPRIRIDEPADSRKPAHPQLTVSSSEVVIAWEEDDGDVRRIRVRSISPDVTAPRWSPRLGSVMSTEIAATASYPALSASPAGVLLAWTSTGPGSAVRVARVEP